MFRQVLCLLVAFATIALFSQAAMTSRAEDDYANEPSVEEETYTEETYTEMEEEKPNVQLKLDVAKVRLLEPEEADEPNAEFTAVITMVNRGKDIVGVSRTGFTFYLFDAKDRPVAEITWEKPDGPDMMPLEPNEPATYRIKCRVVNDSLRAGKPYRLVTVGYGGAALKSSEFKK